MGKTASEASAQGAYFQISLVSRAFRCERHLCPFLAPVSRRRGFFRSLPTALKAETASAPPPSQASGGRDTQEAASPGNQHTSRNETVLIPASPGQCPGPRIAGGPQNTHIMSSNYSSNNRGRSRNGGGRRRSGGSRGSSGGYRGEDRPRSEHKPAKKKGFFAKLLSLIGLGGKKSSSGKPQRTPRTDRPEGSAPRQSRKPERIEVTTPRVYVGNLSFDATESDLLELFGGVGSVQNVEIVSNRETHRSKGFGFVQLTTVEEAKRAVDELHDKEYMGRKLVVSGAKAAPESRGDRSERRESTSESSESEAAAA